jgi:hypothetical protein
VYEYGGRVCFLQHMAPYSKYPTSPRFSHMYVYVNTSGERASSLHVLSAGLGFGVSCPFFRTRSIASYGQLHVGSLRRLDSEATADYGEIDRSWIWVDEIVGLLL